MLSLANPQLVEFYKSSPMREGILNWYPFSKDAHALEDTEGILLRLLSEKCASVTTMDEDCHEQGIYDYVVCMDPKQLSLELMLLFRKKLKPHGRLLLAFDNSYGLQYFAGKRNPKRELPYQFTSGNSKKDVEEYLMKAGYSSQKWYYPFTNHYFAREIYSDHCMPNEFLNHRGHIFIEDDYSKEYDERSVWKEIIRGGAFAFLCNSYLVEACIASEDQACNIDYVANTSYRERDKAFVTTVHSDGTARKQAIYQEGIAGLHALVDNHKDLGRLGVNVLPVQMENHCLSMERVPYPTLWDYWTMRLQKDELKEKELFAHFDRIREAIYLSAQEGRCYWELVPANCFYNQQEDELIFFDQEFFWENTDPDMVLVRAIYALKYSADFQRSKKTSEWISALIERYDLTKKWDTLAEIADHRTKEYVFHLEHTAPIAKELERTKYHMAERAIERTAERARYQMMCKAVGKLMSMGIKHPAIYGYGLRGKMLRYVLEANSMSVAAIIDRQTPVVRGIPLVEAIEQISPEIVPEVIVVTPRCGASRIAEDLRKKMDCPILTIEELVNE